MALEQYLTPYGSSASICFDCRRACGGCSWSESDLKGWRTRFRPVPGWEAEPSQIHPGGFRVTACPLFEREAARESPDGEATEDQLKILLERWREEDF